MTDTIEKEVEYYLGHNEREMNRLQRQHLIFAPFTRQLLSEAGIRPGMKVLDVGSGTGDVAFLLAEIVGETGHVTSLDMNEAMLQTARMRATQAGLTNVTFMYDNLEELALEDKFDAVVGRWILMWVNDPVKVLQTLAQRVKPGGVMAFQETIFLDQRAFPRSEVLEDLRIGKKLGETMDKLHFSPDHKWIGLSLSNLFQKAWLPAPTVRIDTPVGGGPDWEGYQLIEDSLRSLSPAIRNINPEVADSLELDTLASRLRAETVAQQGVIMLAPVVGAWTKI